MKDGERSKGKGRSVCLGANFVKFLAALAVLPLDDLEEMIEFFQVSNVSFLNAVFFTVRKREQNMTNQKYFAIPYVLFVFT